MNRLSVSHRKKRLDALFVRKQSHLQDTMQKRLALGLTTIGALGLSQAFVGFYIEVFALLILFPLYVFAVFRTRAIRRQVLRIQALSDFYQKQVDLKMAKGLTPPDVESFPNADLCRDLDLHEFFAHFDCSLSLQGADELKLWMCEPSRSPLTLDERHEALQELAKTSGVLRRLQILFPKEKIDLNRLHDSLKLPFSDAHAMWRWLLPLFWIINVFNIYMGQMDFAKFGFIIYCGLTLTYLKSTNAGFTRAQDILKSLESLEPIFQAFSKWTPQQIQFAKDLTSKEPSKKLGAFRRYVSLMSLRANPILFYLINFAVPWSLVVVETGEKSRLDLVDKFAHWKAQLIAMDVLGALANLYIYHTSTLPNIEPGLPLKFRGLRHPLIPANKVILNDFDQNQSQIFLITGSNMSGKSTFIRATGLNIVLAQMGGPVFAHEFSCSTDPIVSCIRVSDSLRDGRSYFYSEVQRLKSILVRARSEKVLFLIDEPLRGTNNRERLAGNQAYLAQLVATKSKGFICTHDLELTKLEGQIDGLENFHFTEVWKNSDLVFDYKIHQGPSKSTNALKILEKEGLLTNP